MENPVAPTPEVRYVKFLDKQGASTFRNVYWPLPYGGQPSKWTEKISGFPVICQRGWHYCDTNHLWEWASATAYEVEGGDIVASDGTKYAANTARLLRLLPYTRSMWSGLIADFINLILDVTDVAERDVIDQLGYTEEEFARDTHRLSVLPTRHERGLLIGARDAVLENQPITWQQTQYLHGWCEIVYQKNRHANRAIGTITLQEPYQLSRALVGFREYLRLVLVELQSCLLGQHKPDESLSILSLNAFRRAVVLYLAHLTKREFPFLTGERYTTEKLLDERMSQMFGQRLFPEANILVKPESNTHRYSLKASQRLVDAYDDYRRSLWQILK